MACLSGLLSFGSGVPSSPPKLYYFPISGRGELSRLIACVGGLEIEDITDAGDVDKLSFGSPGSLPVLQHGDLKIAQSTAIQVYLAGIAPKYVNLKPQQQAVDVFFMCAFEDTLSGFAKILFSGKMESIAKKELPAVIDKWFPIFESKLPEKGFVNGLTVPTAADLCVLIISEGEMPFRAVQKAAGIKNVGDKYPKMKAMVERVMEYPEVKNYLAASKTIAGTL